MLSTAAALAAAALAVGGCGAGETAKKAADGAAGALDPVAQAADVTDAQKGGISMSVKGSVTTAGQKLPVQGSGTFDRKGKRGTFSMTTSAAGQTIQIDEVLDGHVIYMRSDAFKGRLPGGKSWMKLDLDAAAKQQGIDLSAISGGGATSDPSQMLDYLKGAGVSKKLGTEQVDGVQTTRYHVDADLTKAAKRSTAPGAQASFDKLIKMIGSKTIPVDVWVDAQHRVRREHLAYSFAVQGEKGAMDLTTDLTGFDVPVKATVPDEGDTVDALKVMGGTTS
jgi:hypothetical protein